jgi:probable rRNA maturation factor
LNIKIFYDGVEYRLRSWGRIKNLVEKVITKENRVSGDLNFIMTNDKTLKEMNFRYLKHNYNTDVISFGWGEGKTVEGEIYISVDTVKRNAHNYKVSYINEFVRVIIHGTLHLCGYNDVSPTDKIEMRRMEDFWLDRYKEL